MADAEWDRTLSRLPDGTLRRRAEHETAGALVATALLLAAAKKAAEQLAAARLVAAQRATADDLSDRDRVAARESAPISEATGEFSRQEITAAGAAGDLAIAHADAAEELAAAHADAAEELAAAARTAAIRAGSPAPPSLTFSTGRAAACDAAMDMDRTMFRYCGCDLSIETRLPYGDPVCRVVIRKKA